MARRRQANALGSILLGVLAGIIWFVSAVGKAIANAASDPTIVLVSAVVLVSVVCLVFLIMWLEARTKERIRQSLFQKVEEATNQHLAALVRKRTQLVQPDAYGNLKWEKWNKELNYFIFQHLQPTLTAEEQAALPKHGADLEMTVEKLVSSAIQSQPTLQAFSDDMDPIEFESYCAEELRRVGWNARTTLQSRDQGVDVIVEKKVNCRAAEHRSPLPGAFNFPTRYHSELALRLTQPSPKFFCASLGITREVSGVDKLHSLHQGFRC